MKRIIFLVFAVLLVASVCAADVSLKEVSDKDYGFEAKIPEGAKYGKLDRGYGKIDYGILNDAGFPIIIEVNGNKVTLEARAEIIYKYGEVKEYDRYNIRGRGSIEVNGQEINNIKDASIGIKDKKVVTAYFDSTAEENYVFSFNNKNYSFKTKPGSKVKFDASYLGNDYAELSATNSIITYEGTVLSGDIEGALYKDGPIFKVKGSYEDSKSSVKCDGSDFSVYLNGGEGKSGESYVSVLGKGENQGYHVRGNLKFQDSSLLYEGTTDSYLQYNKNEKNFDVWGDCTIDNGKHKISFRNGKSYLSSLESEKEAESFSYRFNKKEGLIDSNVYTTIDEETGNVESYNTITKKRVIVSKLKNYEAKISPEAVSQREIGELDDKIASLDEEISKGSEAGEDTSLLIEERDNLQLQKLGKENNIDLIRLDNIKKKYLENVRREKSGIPIEEVEGIDVDSLIKKYNDFSQQASGEARKNSKFVLANLYYAKAFLKGGDIPQESVEIFNELGSDNPDLADVGLAFLYADKANFYLASGDMEKAREAYQKVYDRVPESELGINAKEAIDIYDDVNNIGKVKTAYYLEMLQRQARASPKSFVDLGYTQEQVERLQRGEYADFIRAGTLGGIGALLESVNPARLVSTVTDPGEREEAENKFDALDSVTSKIAELRSSGKAGNLKEALGMVDLLSAGSPEYFIGQKFQYDEEKWEWRGEGEPPPMYGENPETLGYVKAVYHDSVKIVDRYVKDGRWVYVLDDGKEQYGPSFGGYSSLDGVLYKESGDRLSEDNVITDNVRHLNELKSKIGKDEWRDTTYSGLRGVFWINRDPLMQYLTKDYQDEKTKDTELLKVARMYRSENNFQYAAALTDYLKNSKYVGSEAKEIFDDIKGEGIFNLEDETWHSSIPNIAVSYSNPAMWLGGGAIYKTVGQGLKFIPGFGRILALGGKLEGLAGQGGFAASMVFNQLGNQLENVAYSSLSQISPTAGIVAEQIVMILDGTYTSPSGAVDVKIKSFAEVANKAGLKLQGEFKDSSQSISHFSGYDVNSPEYKEMIARMSELGWKKQSIPGAEGVFLVEIPGKGNAIFSPEGWDGKLFTIKEDASSALKTAQENAAGDGVYRIKDTFLVPEEKAVVIRKEIGGGGGVSPIEKLDTTAVAADPKAYTEITRDQMYVPEDLSQEGSRIAPQPNALLLTSKDYVPLRRSFHLIGNEGDKRYYTKYEYATGENLKTARDYLEGKGLEFSYLGDGVYLVTDPNNKYTSTIVAPSDSWVSITGVNSRTKIDPSSASAKAYPVVSDVSENPVKEIEEPAETVTRDIIGEPAEPEIAPEPISRTQEAEQLLGISLSEEQAQAVQQAHETGKGMLGAKREDGTYEKHPENPYTTAELLAKSRILKESGFTEEQIRTLIEHGIVGNEDAKLLIRTLEDPASTSSRKLEAVIALSDMKAIEAVPALIEATKDANNHVRRVALYALGNIKTPEAVQALIEATKDAKLDVRLEAARGLGDVGSKEAVQALIETTKDSDVLVKAAAARGLGNIGSKEAVPVLIELVKYPDFEVESAVIEALGNIGSKEAVQALIETTKDSDSAIQFAAAQALGNIKNPEALPALIEATKDSTSWVRTAAARGLGSIKTPEAVPVLIELVKDSNPDVRQAALFALGDIKTPEIVQAVIEATKDSKPDVRQAALFALGDIKTPEIVQALIKAAEDSKPDVRQAAIIALGNIGSKEAVPVLIKVIEDPNRNVRTATIKSLGQIGTPEAVQALADYLKNVDSDTRETIATFLLKNPDRNAISKMVKLNDPKVNSKLEASLETLLSRNDPELFDELINSNSPIRRHSLTYKSWLEGRRLTDAELQEKGFSLEDNFPYAGRLEKILGGNEKKKVVVIQAIKDGQGDENIRLSLLTQGLVDEYPNAEAVIYSNKNYLYENTPRRVTVKTLDELTEPPKTDVLIYFSNKGGETYDPNSRIDNLVSRAGTPNTNDPNAPKVIIKGSKSSDNFAIDQVMMDGELGFNIPSQSNVYSPSLRLMVELGLRPRIGKSAEAFSDSTSIFLGDKDNANARKAEEWWQENVAPASEGRKVIGFNPFGGESVDKGYRLADNEQRKKFVQDVEAVLDSGNSVIIFPNEKAWGTPEMIKEALDDMNPEKRKFVVIAPSPQESGSIIKHIVHRADSFIAVEGGMAHLVKNMDPNKPMVELLFPASGPEKWIPVLGETEVAKGLEVPSQDIGRIVSRSEVSTMENREKAESSKTPETKPASKTGFFSSVFDTISRWFGGKKAANKKIDSLLTELVAENEQYSKTISSVLATASKEEIAKIQLEHAQNTRRVQEAYQKAVNKKLDISSDEAVLFHGTKDIEGIQESGLRINNENTRSNFGGRGIYFTSSALYAQEYAGLEHNGRGLGEGAGKAPAVLMLKINPSEIAEVDVNLVNIEVSRRLDAMNLEVPKEIDAEYLKKMDEINADITDQVIDEMTQGASIVRLRNAQGEVIGFDEFVIKDPSILKDIKAFDNQLNPKEGVISADSASFDAIQKSSEMFYIEPEMLDKYLFGELSTGEGHKRDPVAYPRGLEQLVEDYAASRPEAKRDADLLKNAERALEAEGKEKGFEDARSYLETLSSTDSVIYDGKTYLYEELKAGADFHDLARNMEMREGFELMGFRDAAAIESVIKKQISDENLVKDPDNPNPTIFINGETYPSRIYRSVIIGPNGKKAMIESRWIIRDNILTLSTAIWGIPPSGSRILPRKTNLERVSSNGWVDRLVILRIILVFKDFYSNPILLK